MPPARDEFLENRRLLLDRAAARSLLDLMQLRFQ